MFYFISEMEDIRNLKRKELRFIGTCTCVVLFRKLVRHGQFLSSENRNGIREYIPSRIHSFRPSRYFEDSKIYIHGRVKTVCELLLAWADPVIAADFTAHRLRSSSASSRTTDGCTTAGLFLRCRHNSLIYICCWWEPWVPSIWLSYSGIWWA
jgi:hypothetical protein